MSLLLNAVFHHSLMMIPQQEIPGTIPSAYVMRHPETGAVEVNITPHTHTQLLICDKKFIYLFYYYQLWWSPCPSRECPEEEEIDIVVDQCLDHCLLLEQNPKIEIMPPPTNAPVRPTPDNGDVDDLNFHLTKRKHALLAAKNGNGFSSSTSSSTSTSTSSSSSTSTQSTPKSLYFNPDISSSTTAYYVFSLPASITEDTSRPYSKSI